MILALLQRYWLNFAVIILLGVVFTSGSLMGAKRTEAAWKLKWAERDEADAKAHSQRLLEARIEEQRRQGEIDEIRQQANQQISAVQQDADRAHAASRGLHQHADRLARKLAERERACAAGTAGAGQTKTSGSELLAELFRSADQRAGEMARAADEARARGLACQAAYNTIQSAEIK
ncbi:DUF2514 family protein [Serratia microhaemolytica]|uniref:DUF2514 family protein n=1 Tax=Serratia microhaemolytica TaxID=2675110 RepID=UPI000FDD0149|nr:DUF2514 family protein [Serratia microhaemolytica]